jgi:CubicO group peptidase (beta-lactamase class C family)
MMRIRLFEPTQMTDTAIQTKRMVEGGKSSSGRRVQPWVIDELAPEGGAVTTSKDLAILATAIFDGTAPGLDALTATTATDSDITKIGILWGTTRLDDGQMIIQHSGMTSGYSSFMGLDLQHKKAVIVLSDVAKSVDDVGYHHSPTAAE